MAMKRAARYALIGAAVVAVVVAGLVLWLTRTQSGVERAGRFALDQVRGSINGELVVGSITSDGGILRGVTLHDVALTGEDDRPFVEADSARLGYRLGTLLSGSIVFDRLELYDPEVVVEKLPDDERWNYERLFAGDTAAPDTTRDDLVLLRDITVRNGRVVVRMPWELDEPVESGDTARMELEAIGGGFVRVLRFEELDARLPRIVWDAPGEDTRLIEVGSLSTRAFVWDTPAEIQALAGVITLRDSLISFDAAMARLPNSELGLVGQLIVQDSGNRYDIDIDGRDLAFSDFQWLYPSLPEEGGGTLQFRMQTQEDPGTMLWLVREARLRTGGTDVAGSFGVITGDTLYFTNVDLEASPLDLELLQELVPSAIPLDGLLIGTVEVEGPVSALETRGDAVLTAIGENSRVRWSGSVGVGRPWAARQLDLDVQGADLERVARFAPGLRLRGLASGRVRASGSLEDGLALTGDVALDRDGERSAVHGSGLFAVGGDRSAFDLRFDADSVGLDLLTEQFPALGPLAGRASGPVTVIGSLDDLNVDVELDTPAGGLALRGSFGFTGEVPRYRADGAVTSFEVDRILRDLPPAAVTARFEIEGQGATVESVEADATVHVARAIIDGIEVRQGAARGRVADGLVRVDSLLLVTGVGALHAAGSFGILDDRSGELVVNAHGEQLALLEPVVFRRPASDGTAARLGGDIEATGVLTGSFQRWAAKGRATARGLVYDRVRVGDGTVEFEVDPSSGSVRAEVDSLRYGDRHLTRGAAGIDWADGAGRFSWTGQGLGEDRLRLEGTFARPADSIGSSTLEVGLSTLELAAGDGVWTAGPFAGTIARDGVSLDSVALRRLPDGATIRLGGLLPWHRGGDTARAAMTLELDSVPIGELLRVAQTDTAIDGIVTGRLELSGTALDPVIDGRVAARPFRYAGAVFDSARGVLRYDARQLRGNFGGWSGARRTITGSGAVPLDLALADRDERLLAEPLTVHVQADSLPAGLASFLMPGFEEVDGTVNGRVALEGTGRDPQLLGRLSLTDGSAFFRPLRVHYETMDVTAEMETGSLVRVIGRLGTGQGLGHVAGTVDVSHPTDPTFDLDITASRLVASRRRDVVATVTGRARVTGRYTRPVVSGELQILEGEMNLDEIWRQFQMVRLDPSIFQMIDSATVAFRPPEEIPFLENLRITNTTVTADRGFWLRSQQLNVEVSGSLETEVDRQTSNLQLTGTLQAIGGAYAFHVVQGVPARIFDIRAGTIEFVGTPGIDPNLDMEALYRVRRAQGDPINVVAAVSGTLQAPRVALASDADLPLSESDLASYILFGRSGAELTQAQSDVVSRGLGLVRPVATGLLSSELQRALSGSGLPIDHIAFTTPEYGLDQLGSYWQSRGLVGVFHNTQLEVGLDAGPDLSLVGSVRIPTDASDSPDGSSPWRMFGARVEWRFRPSWTTEFYVEDRFARIPSFGLAEIDDRKVWGLSLFRDWGY